MNRSASARALVPLAACVMLVSGPRTAAAGEVALDGRTFTLPDGFAIERVAGPPLVDRPIVADFDEQGRLYVADSSGSNDKVEKQLAEKPHRIVRLEDADGDGRYDRRTVFADRMMFPEGTMWFDGSLYVAAPPSIWKLTDADGDGVAEQREEWFQGRTLTGCANDLHGPYLGPDGWIYWCKGAFAKQTYERPGRPPFVTRAAHIFRCRPDGSGIEPVMTGGMDNPVDVAFTPGGERIVTATFLQHPGGGRRDGLIHAVYGGVYGKVHDVIEDHPRTGPDVLPVLAHLGPAAPCGLARYESDVFGAEYEDNLFAALFNLHKVSRHVLTLSGATFTSRDEDFLVASDLDFHPTDVLEDADGSLLVIDTGGWYKLCCPTSQLGKPDVLGAIYRVRRVGAPRLEDPRGLKLTWAKMTAAELTQWLDDPRPAVRHRAIHTLAQRGEDAAGWLGSGLRDPGRAVGGAPPRGLEDQTPATHRSNDSQPKTALGASAHGFEDEPVAPETPSVPQEKPIGWRSAVPALAEVIRAARSAEARRNAVWAVTRIEPEPARAVVRRALADADETVRQAAIHAASVWRDRAAVPRLLELLKRPSPQNRRAAAEALGRIGDKVAVPALLEATADASDRVLEHALTFALIEIADPHGTAAGLKSPSALTRRAALIALDQMDGGGLEPRTVAADLASPNPVLKEAATWIAGRHPEWGGALAGFLRGRLAATGLPAAERTELEQQLARFARATPVQELLADRLRDASALREERRTALRAMAQSGLKQVPMAWITGLAEVLAGADAELIGEAVSTARALAVPEASAEELVAGLRKVARDAGAPADVRLVALAAVPGGLSEVDPGLFGFLLDQVRPDRPVATRSAAADVLARAKLSRDELISLADALATAGPLEVERLLAAFARSTDEDVGLRLVSALKRSPALSAVRRETLTPLLARFGPRVRQPAEELDAALRVDAAQQTARLEEMVSALASGDARRGQVVFNGPKAACAACHAIGYLGGKVGPDLTRIGQVRTERDLLEAIVFPSASLVRSYEPVVVATRDGRVVSGVLRQDAADAIVLATGANQEARIARDDIEEMRPGTVSVMPAGLDQQLTEQELADLVAFLKACR